MAGIIVQTQVPKDSTEGGGQGCKKNLGNRGGLKPGPTLPTV